MKTNGITSRKPRAGRKPVFVVCDDDSRQTMVELLQGDFPGCTFKPYASLAEARDCGTVDILLTDTSAISAASWQFVPSALAKWMSLHPGADVFIFSGMSRNAVQDFIDEMRESYETDTSRCWPCGILYPDLLTCLRANYPWFPK